MSDLESFRDYCRRMSGSTHNDECSDPNRHPWQSRRPDPKCKGCITPRDRALWAHLADEVDDYLTDEQQPALAGAADVPLEGL